MPFQILDVVFGQDLPDANDRFVVQVGAPAPTTMPSIQVPPPPPSCPAGRRSAVECRLSACSSSSARACQCRVSVHPPGLLHISMAQDGSRQELTPETPEQH